MMSLNYTIAEAHAVLNSSGIQSLGLHLQITQYNWFIVITLKLKKNLKQGSMCLLKEIIFLHVSEIVSYRVYEHSLSKMSSFWEGCNV